MVNDTGAEGDGRRAVLLGEAGESKAEPPFACPLVSVASVVDAAGGDSNRLEDIVRECLVGGGAEEFDEMDAELARVGISFGLMARSVDESELDELDELDELETVDIVLENESEI